MDFSQQVNSLLQTQPISLASGKKIYFASDFHLGVPNYDASLIREKKIVAWLESIQPDAAAIFLLGDLFDFWFEYSNVAPKGFIRLLGKIAEITDAGIPVIVHTGNHDMWMFDYLPKEIGVTIYRGPQSFECNGKKFCVGHGDGLGPGDYTYKFLKKFFNSSVCQWLFARIHPNLGIGIANFWSHKSRLSNNEKDEGFKGAESEYLWQWCRTVQPESPHDYYIFGHRHLPLDLQVSESARYINLGEWVNHQLYAVFDGTDLKVHHHQIV